MPKRLKVLLTVRPAWLLVVAVAIAFAGGLLIPTAPTVRGPLLSVENSVLIAALVGLGVLVGNLYMQRGQDLARIGKLEDDLKAAQKDLHSFRDENSTLRDALNAAASFINRVGLRLMSGRGPWPQPPEQIASHIDAELWDDIPAGGTD